MKHRGITLSLVICSILSVFLLNSELYAEERLSIPFLEEPSPTFNSIDIDFSLKEHSWYFPNDGPFSEVELLGKLESLKAILPKGICFGMCLTAGLSYLNKITLPKCKDPYLLPEVWKKTIYNAQYEGVNLYVGPLGWWVIPKITTRLYFTPKRIIADLESSLRSKVPCILFVKLKDTKKNHTVLAYGIEVENEDIKILVYDPNFPLEERHIEFKRNINTQEVEIVDRYYETIFYIWKIKEIVEIPKGSYSCNTDSGRVEIIKISTTPTSVGTRIDFRVKNNSSFKKWLQFSIDYTVSGKLWSDVRIGLDNVVLEVGEVKDFSYVFRIKDIKRIKLKIRNRYTQDVISEYWINL